MLEEAGWVVGEDSGTREKDGVALRMQLCTSSGNPTRLTALGKIDQYLAAIGIKSDISTEDASSVYFAGWAEHHAGDAVLHLPRHLRRSAVRVGPDGGHLRRLLPHLPQLPSTPSDANPNGSNNTRVSSPTLDAALEALGKELDLGKQYEAAAVVQSEMNKAIAEIPALLPRGGHRHQQPRRRLGEVQPQLRRPHVGRRALVRQPLEPIPV